MVADFEPRAALALADDLLKQQRMTPGAVLGRKGGSTTARKLGADHYRNMAAVDRARKPNKLSTSAKVGIRSILLGGPHLERGLPARAVSAGERKPNRPPHGITYLSDVGMEVNARLSNRSPSTARLPLLTVKSTEPIAPLMLGIRAFSTIDVLALAASGRNAAPRVLP